MLDQIRTVTKRYAYERKDGAWLSAAMNKLGLSKRDAAWLFATKVDRVQAWLDDLPGSEIPHTHAMLITVWMEVPGALDAAWDYTNSVSDDRRPSSRRAGANG